MSNQQLAEQLYKPIIRKFANMQLISKFNIGFWFLLCVIDNFSKYTCVADA